MGAMAQLKLGYKASAEQFGPQELLEFGVHAERCGFDSVLVSDHFQPWRHTGGHAPFSFTWLAALGARTQRVLLGASVLTPTFRYHPAALAQAMGTLGRLVPGRVLVELGTGDALNAVAPLGMAWLDNLIEVKVSFDTDRQRAREDTRHWGALALSAEEKTGVEDPLEMERLADALPTERTASRWIVSTDPQEHVERIRFYTDLGFTHLVFHAPGPDQRRFLDLYAEHILPRLRL